MYLDFFGLNELPFSIAPDPRYLYMSERHREALAHLLYGVGTQGGFVLLTGEVGTGKTTTCRCFLNQVPGNTDVAYIVNPKLSAVGLLEAICDELHIPYPPSPSVKHLNNAINDYLLKAHAGNRHTVLIIDEAQNLSRQVLEQLRLLTNLETSEKKLLQIVLIGQPELRDMLASPELRQVAQRITAHYHLDNLNKEELGAYLRCRLAVAGRRLRLFTPAATRVLYKTSHGIPRLINLIADRALLGAYAEHSELVEAGHVKLAAKEMVLQRPPRWWRQLLLRMQNPVWMSALASLSVILLAGVFLATRPMSPSDGGANRVVAEPPQPTSEPAGSRVAAVVEAPQASDSVAETKANAEGVIALVNPSAGIESGQVSKVQALSSVSLRGDGKSEAYVELIRAWSLPLELAPDQRVCPAVYAWGLECLHKQGNWRSLTQLNRPAVLSLLSAEGKRFHVTLLKVRGADVQVAVEGQKLWTSREDLEQYWLGEYTLFWRLPPYQSPLIQPKQERDRDVWLENQLNMVLQQSGVSGVEIGAMSLEQKIRAFQSSRGLVVDGIIGSMTLIQLNSLTDTESPTLFSEG